MTEFDIGYSAAFVAGLLSFLSPCVLPLVPPYLCFLAGVSLEQLTDLNTSANAAVGRRVFVRAFAFVCGFASVFVLLGLSASLLGQLVAEHLQTLSIIAGVVIVVLGLHFLGVFKLTVLYKEMRFQTANSPAGLLGAYVVGLAFAFGWTPCVGPVLAAVLMLAASEDSIWQGAGLLGLYALGIGIPFLLAALLARPFLLLMRRFRPFMGRIEQLMGAMLVVTGLLFITGTVNDIGFWLQETFPILGTIG